MRRLLPILLVPALVVLGCAEDGSDSDESSDSTATSTSTTGPTPPAIDAVTAESDLPAETQDQLEHAVVAAMNDEGIPGAFVGVFLPDGSWEAVAGTADLASGDPVGPGMSWPVRSLTKSMVVTLLLQQVDAGTVTLDDTVDQYLDDVPNGDTITLRMLADMSAGLPNYTATDAFLEAFVADPERDYTIEDLNELAFTEEVEFEPGTEHTYSNTNTNVLGQVLEVSGGAPLGEQLQAEVFGPLSMAGTTYLPPDLPEPHAVGYQPTPDGYVEPPNNFSAMGPSGAVVSTTDDLRIWAEALGTGSLISPELHTERLVGEPLVEGPVYDAYGMGIGSRFGYWGHTGQGLGFTALAMHDPDTGASIVIVANASETETQPMDALFAAVAPIIDER